MSHLKYLIAITLFLSLWNCTKQPLDSFRVESCYENDIWTRFDYHSKRKQIDLGDSSISQDLIEYIKTLDLSYDICGYANVYLKVPNTIEGAQKYFLIPSQIRSDIPTGVICCFFFTPKWILINNKNQILYRDSIFTNSDNLRKLVKSDYLKYSYQEENIVRRPPYMHLHWDSATNTQTIIEVINATNSAYIEAINEKLLESGINVDLCSVQKGTLDRVLGENYQLQFLISLGEEALTPPPPPPPPPTIGE